MKPIVADVNLIACCGLYCGACGAYRRGRCPGCRENQKASWCGVRRCCRETNRSTCADCAEHADPRDCKQYNHWIARLFGWVFRSDRRACILQIRQLGPQGHAETMAAQQRQSLPRE